METINLMSHLCCNTEARGFIYRVTLAGSSGTNPNDPPSHESGAATATGGTAEFTFIGYIMQELLQQLLQQ